MYFGEALYYAHQGQYFEALERLDAEVRQHQGVDEPELDTLFRYIADAEFSLGDFELRYRMHHRAGRAIRAVLEGAVDETIRNDAAFRLARIHFQKGQAQDALAALDRIEGKVPEGIRDDIEFLRANVYLAEDQPGDAIDVLKALESSDRFGGFASYNLGVALLKAGQYDAAIEQLAKAGQREARTPDELAIRDKANLVLGSVLIDEDAYAAARPYLSRVRLDGPFSNKALLSAGWASVSDENYERAVVPWSILADREVTDPATQEAMLALPYAYGKLDVHGRAAVHYGRALDAFGAEIEKLDRSVESIREGRFLEALIREEIRRNQDWVIRLRTLPETPETYYMLELLASHDFQTGLQNYLDLADLHRKLTSWQRGFDAYDEMVGIRRGHYEPLLPTVDEEFRALDSRIRLRAEQHRTLVRRMNDLLTVPRPEFLATREEQAILGRLDVLAAGVEDLDEVTAKRLQRRIRRLRGSVMFTLETEYHERLARFDAHLAELNDAMDVMRAAYDEYVRTRQAATHSFEGYQASLDGLRARVGGSIDTVWMLMARQGRELEVAAIDELTVRRERLANYRDKARFALADSYDRATQSQARSGELQ
jgi:predicted negative regulator of RcsB-dependent stress response